MTFKKAKKEKALPALKESKAMQYGFDNRRKGREIQRENKILRNKIVGIRTGKIVRGKKGIFALDLIFGILSFLGF